MAVVWRGLVSRIRYRRRRLLGDAVRKVPLLLGAIGLVLLALAATGTALHPRFRIAPYALPFLTAALALRWWRAPEEGLPDALRLRRRSRRIALRFASVPGVGAASALALAVGRHGTPAHDAYEAALWLAVAAPVPVLAELALWRLAPTTLQRDIRIGGLVEQLQDLNARSGRRGQLVFDPELGHAGRVVPRRHNPRPDVPGAPRAVVPDHGIARRMTKQMLTFAEERWIVNASICWDGAVLVVTDIGGRRVASPALRGARGLVDEPVELVWVLEQVVGDPVLEAWVLLLDAQDRVLLTMSGLGFDAREVADLAAAAGLAFSSYRLLLPGAERLGHTLLPRMFPRRRGHIRLQVGIAPV